MKMRNLRPNQPRVINIYLDIVTAIPCTKLSQTRRDQFPLYWRDHRSTHGEQHIIERKKLFLKQMHIGDFIIKYKVFR